MPQNTRTFSAFLKTKIRDENHVGEFARDWLHDTHNGRPRGGYKWKAVRRYLEGRGAVENCIIAAEAAWTEWTKVQDAKITNLTPPVDKHTKEACPACPVDQAGQIKTGCLSKGNEVDQAGQSKKDGLSKEFKA